MYVTRTQYLPDLSSKLDCTSSRLKKQLLYSILKNTEYLTETLHEVILNSTLQMGSHSNSTNWVISDCRYDVLLQMPWNAKDRSTVDCLKETADIKGARLFCTALWRNKAELFICESDELKR